MVTKSKIKREIDKLPNELLEKVYKYITSVKVGDIERKKLPSFKLKGKFDSLNIREKAYE